MDCTLNELLREFVEQRLSSNKYFRVYTLIGEKETKFVMSGSPVYLFEHLPIEIFYASVVSFDVRYTFRYNRFKGRRFKYFRILVKPKKKQGTVPPASDDD